jgi:hypothetical protein
MILLSEEVRAWGHVVTMHYSHEPRSVVTQAGLCSRMDFTETEPGNSIVRAVAFFTDFLANGISSDLAIAPHHGASQFHAQGLTEFRAQLIADNCGSRALISQFATTTTTTTTADAFAEPAAAHVITFHDPGNGTIAFKHIAKTFGHGRPIDEAEAVAAARGNAARFGVDLDSVEMVVAADIAAASAAQRFDVSSGKPLSTSP